MTDKKPDIWFVYDGECPICQMGASLFKLREAVGTLSTVDARTELDHPVIHEVNAAKLNLDEGMVIKYKGKLYQGDETLVLMANIGSMDTLFNRINTALFKSKTMSRLSYPFMRGARNLALFLKGAGRIDNLK